MMKKIALFIFTALCNLYCMGQANNVSTVVNIQIPQRATLINTNKLSAINNSRSSNYTYLSDLKKFYQNIYELDGITMVFKDLEVEENNKRTLEESKMELLEMLKRNRSNIINEAKILNINNINVLVLRYQSSSSNYLHFYTDYKNNRSFSGVLIYDIGKYDVASKIFDELFKNIAFK